MTIQSLDTGLLQWINRGMANAAFDVLMPALSERGYLLVVPFLLAVLLRGARQQSPQGTTFLAAAIWTILVACCAWYLSGLAENALKVAVARVRPCCALADIRLLIPCPKSFSMPSGHATSSFAVAVPLFYLTRRYIEIIWRLYPLLLASLIAFSRMYIGVHYPTDVLAGAFLGGCIGLALSILYQAIATEEIIKQRKS